MVGDVLETTGKDKAVTLQHDAALRGQSGGEIPLTPVEKKF